MKVLSVNVGMPREVEINGRPVLTGIDKAPVAQPLWLGALGLAGDGQADLTVHGGPFQAVYSYPFEHYAHWSAVLGCAELPFGTFGENLTTTGLLEDEVCVGDIWHVGGARLQVTMPRLPCFKFGHKIGAPAILKDFLHSGHSGFYHRVLEEGTITAGDEIRVLEREPHGITVRQILGLQRLGEGDESDIERALEIDYLPPSLRRDLTARLEASR